MEKLRLHLFQQFLYGCVRLIDDKSCVTVIVNTFVVLLNLSVAVPIAVELFVGTSFDPINISAEKVVILGPEVDSSSLQDKLTKRNNAVNELINFS
jgi:hypothetical protein